MGLHGVYSVVDDHIPTSTDAYEAALGSISDLWEADAALAPPWPELLSILPHDRSRGLQTNADATSVMT